MEFGTLALVNTASAATTAGATILLALAGFSYMSVAWAMLAAAGTTTLLSFSFRPDLSILRPAFKSWGSVLSVRWLQRRQLRDQPDLRGASPARSGPDAAAFGGRLLQSCADGVRHPGQDRLGERVLDRVPGARGGDTERPQPEGALSAGAQLHHGVLLAGAGAACAAGLPDRVASPGPAVARALRLCSRSWRSPAWPGSRWS